MTARRPAPASFRGTVSPPAILPRSEWAQGLEPTGPLEAEAAGDVRFLLVHHSASPNEYDRDGVARTLRSFYETHTGPAKGWHDIAYNFLIDRFGRIWEGRAGSIDQPMKGDATGGSQGFALLCCFIGEHTSVPPSAEAQTAMASLLAYLADRYSIDPTPGATVTFASRGSNRYPAGSSVTVTTIAGHRDVSATECPGDAAYPLVQSSLAPRAAAMVADAAAPPTTTTTTTTTETTATPQPSSTSTPTSPTSASDADPSGGGADPDAATGGDGSRLMIPTAAAVACAAVGGLIALRRRRG
ncbi:MAG: N-acetylmuramoyl-L-alanine amidase [Acidimicrobiales bacterium]|nr:N-acetylmuramoyl-L-alanine amidase [Acidimicrobiales bacterium]